jgi:hypothetical protein
VYLLWHSGASEPDDGPLLLGVYSSRERAEARIAGARQQPGFRDYPDRFEVVAYEVDKDEWTRGFATYEYVIDDSSEDHPSR